MEPIKLIGFEKREIKNVSGRGVSFKKIRIPNEDCSHFMIRYEILNSLNGSKLSSPIHCLPSVYQRDVSQVILSKSILIPENCILNIQIESGVKPNFKGEIYIDYEIFVPTVKKVFISEKDRQNAFRVALINLARFFKIPDWEYEDNQTLYNKIKVVTHPIVQLLQNYFTAYNKWFQFYERIKKIETERAIAYDLTEKDRNELSELIQKRQETLDILQAKFDDLQFERFKEEHGLGNVDGIIL